MIVRTHSAYGYGRGCRCDVCTRANTVECREKRARRLRKPVPSHVHGTIGGYNNWGCRCEACSDVWRQYLQTRKEPVG